MSAAAAAQAASAWSARELANCRERWSIHLQRREVEELTAATARCVDAGRDVLDLERADFPLPRLGTRLAALRAQALNGVGVALLRGLPVGAASMREAATMFWGIGTHLGVAVSQNAHGHVLGHVTDLGLDYRAADVRGYQTRARLPYHTDYSDLVALLCLRGARKGGLSSIASSVRLYVEMHRHRPDLARILAQPFLRTRWGEVSPGQPPWLEVPVFNLHAAGVSTTYVRSAIDKAQRLPGVPALTEQQAEALDHLDALAGDPEFHLDMHFEAGDLQILNNHHVLHSRTAYVDHDDGSRRRHLLRLWLACEDGPPFPQGMTAQFQGLTRNGRPNGIHIEGVPFTVPLDAVTAPQGSDPAAAPADP